MANNILTNYAETVSKTVALIAQEEAAIDAAAELVAEAIRKD